MPCCVRPVTTPVPRVTRATSQVKPSLHDFADALRCTALRKSRILAYRDLIWNTLDHNVSNARSEATNFHLRALTKRAYGYHSPEALIGMAMLTRGGLCPGATRPKMTHYNVG